jgi:hypothetical protein
MAPCNAALSSVKEQLQQKNSLASVLPAKPQGLGYM